jgi:molecular chaperone GrpE
MRAAVSAPSTSEAQLRDSLRAWLQGLTFVRQRLLDALAAEGVRPIPALGLPFDPVLHLAIQAVPSTNQPAGTVVSEIRRGYTISGRVLRHAEVAVAQ